MLESEVCASITELAATEKIDRSYLCRVLRLTLLAPEIVKAIRDWQHHLPALMKGFPVDRQEQRSAGHLINLPAEGRLRATSRCQSRWTRPASSAKPRAAVTE